MFIIGKVVNMYAEKGYVSRGDYCNIASGRKTEETIKLQQVNYSMSVSWTLCSFKSHDYEDSRAV